MKSAWAAAVTSWAAALILSTALSTAPVAVAQSPSDLETAKKLFAQGEQLYQQEKYREASERLLLAYELSHRSRILYNVGKCHERLAEYEKAIGYYRRYLTETPFADDQKDVEALIADLEARLHKQFQTLAVRSEPPGADVYLDDHVSGLQGQTPIELQVKPGAHRLFLDKKGFVAVEKNFSMASDRGLELNFDLTADSQTGFLRVACNISGAVIFLDGRSVGLTPYQEKFSVTPGPHQVVLQKDAYEKFNQRVTVTPDQTTVVHAAIYLNDPPLTWRTWTGWSLAIGGTLAAASGAIMNVKALGLNDDFSDSSDFKSHQNLQRSLYWGGATGVLAGAALIGWDQWRSVVAEGDALNPGPGAEQSLTLILWPGGLSVQGSFP